MDETDRFLSRQQLAELGISYSRQHLHRLETAGKFPAHVALSPHKVAWKKSEILAYLTECTRERDRKCAARLAERVAA